MSYNLLFVCTGNTCRSPMAEALARHALAERGRDDVQVASAGTAALPGAPPSEEVPAVLEEVGIGVGDLAATALTAERVGWADLVLVMGPHHRVAVEDLGGGGKVALVTAFLDGPEAGQPVMDPIGAGIETYRATRDQLQRAVQAVVERLESSAP